MNMQPSVAATGFMQQLDHGIFVVDTGFVRRQFDASFLIVHEGRAAFIDSGPNSAVPRLLAALTATGLTPAAVDYVIATHVHLDHAGGVGALMDALPNARLVIHPRGARHMIDPRALMAGVRAVYGEEVAQRDYGELVPVPEARVITSTDAMMIDLNGRPLELVDTPGHARHHHCIWDEVSRGWFTGDTFGIAYPELQTPGGAYIVPATAPVQFDQQALHASVARLLARKPACMYLTHFGRVEEPERLAIQMLSQVDAMAAAARELSAVPLRHEHLKRAFAEIYIAELRRCGAQQPETMIREILATDVELNAQGLGVWLDKQ